jgi:hypothetical protein
MATNLISLIMEYLTPELIGRIASALGLDRNNASTAIGASVPALLAGICGAATQPGGAQKLLDSARQQTGTLDKFSSMIGGDKAGLIDKGSQMLSSLFSSQQQTALAGAVGKFSGLNTGTGSSLLGMLASTGYHGYHCRAACRPWRRRQCSRQSPCFPKGQYRQVDAPRL